MFDRVQLRALAGPLKDIQRHVLKSLLRCLGGVLGVVALLEGEPSPQSEVLSALEQVFQSLPLKNIPQNDAATTMLHRRDGARFPLDVTLGIQAKEFNLGFIRPENLVSLGVRVFMCLLANSKRAVMCLLLRSGFRLATLP